MKHLLIANRGEIASRIIRSARWMGIRTLAVHSASDAELPFVSEADHAVLLPGDTLADTYLNGDQLLQIAAEHSIDAVHPGYGFLSENAEFARAVEAAGLSYVGPPAIAIEAMGSKAAAKARMAAAGVPLIPGYHGDDQSPQQLQAEADRIGYPLLLKASAGGGGKGMRVVNSAEAFSAALESACREARNAFGDERMILERYFEHPRHIEVQIFFDGHGQGLTLLDRDCSLQRRHQKVIEEAPAPHLPEATRQAMAAAALACGQAIDYVGAGTVEFLVDPEANFYFMEMNTRLQVEHPVTEQVTGIDLVEWQLRIADGEPLPLEQGDISSNGHALEARVYAEDPDQDFLPCSGRLERFALTHPLTGEATLRVDAGFESGNTVSPRYDPLLAKVIVHAPTRALACRALAEALNQCRVVGPVTNLRFLQQLIQHPGVSGEAPPDTRFIENHREVLRTPPLNAAESAAAAALIAATRPATPAEGEWHFDPEAASDRQPASPWSELSGWRGTTEERARVRFRRAEVETAEAWEDRRVAWTGSHYRIGAEPTAEGEPQAWHFDLDGSRFSCRGEAGHTAGEYQWQLDTLYLWTDQGPRRLEVQESVGRRKAAANHAEGRIQAPMAGRLVKWLRQEGESVRVGETVVVVEAMKMELPIKAPCEGRLVALRFQDGDAVKSDSVLAEIEPVEPEPSE